jgi:hypothetical protein
MPHAPQPPKKPMPTEQLLAGRFLVEPPRDVLHRAFALKSLLPQAAEGLGAWIVRLVFDSGVQPVPAGVRSGGSSERRLLFEARRSESDPEPRQVDLRIRRESGGGIEILGQCLPPWKAASVEAGSGKAAKSAEVDEAGEFLLRGVSAKGGPIVLRLVVDGREMLVIDAVPVPDVR